MAHNAACSFSNIRKTENQLEFEQNVTVTLNTTFSTAYPGRAPCRIKIVVTMAANCVLRIDHVTQSGTRTTELNGGGMVTGGAQEILYYDVAPEEVNPALATPVINLKSDTSTTCRELSISEIDGAGDD